MFQGYVKLPDGIVALYIKWWLIVKNMESNCLKTLKDGTFSSMIYIFII